MSKLRLNVSSRLALAMMLPVALAACGSSGSAPAASTGAAAGTGGALSSATAPVAGAASQLTTAVGTAAGTAGGDVSSAGNGVSAAGNGLPAPAGPVATATGNTVSATGQSMQNGSLDNPAGVTVVDSAVTYTKSSDLADASVLSNTPANNAPVQAGAASNGQVAAASVAEPGSSNTPVVSPLMTGSQNIVNAATGGESANPEASLPSPPASLNAVGSETAPLNPALDVADGGTQLVGSPSSGAALTAGADSDGKLVNTGLTTPGGAPNPVDTGVSTLTSGTGANLIPK
jgi:hypothetical protein